MKAIVCWVCGSVVAYLLVFFFTLAIGASNDTVVTSVGVTFLLSLVVAASLARRQKQRMFRDIRGIDHGGA